MSSVAIADFLVQQPTSKNEKNNSFEFLERKKRNSFRPARWCPKSGPLTNYWVSVCKIDNILFGQVI